MKKLSPRRKPAQIDHGPTSSTKVHIGGTLQGSNTDIDEPFWVPDQLSGVCMLCKSEFNVLRFITISSLVFHRLLSLFFSYLTDLCRRRHHCRRCGNVLCHSCSSHKAIVSGGSSSSALVRVCNTCFQALDFENNKAPDDHLARMQAARRQRSQSVLAKLDVLQLPRLTARKLSAPSGGTSMIEELSFLSGLLKKVGGKERLWKPRFFKLTPFFLIYYAVAEDDDYSVIPALNRMPIGDITRVFVHDDDTQQFTFTVESSGVSAPLLLSAASEREKVRWMVMIGALTNAMNQTSVLAQLFRDTSLRILFSGHKGGVLNCSRVCESTGERKTTKWRYFPSGALLKTINNSCFKWDGCTLSPFGSWDGVTLVWKEDHYVYVSPQKKFISESDNQRVYTWDHHKLYSETSDIEIILEGDIPHMMALFCILIEEDDTE